MDFITKPTKDVELFHLLSFNQRLIVYGDQVIPLYISGRQQLSKLVSREPELSSQRSPKPLYQNDQEVAQFP